MKWKVPEKIRLWKGLNASCQVRVTLNLHVSLSSHCASGQLNFWIPLPFWLNYISHDDWENVLFTLNPLLSSTPAGTHPFCCDPPPYTLNLFHHTPKQVSSCGVPTSGHTFILLANSDKCPDLLPIYHTFPPNLARVRSACQRHVSFGHTVMCDGEASWNRFFVYHSVIYYSPPQSLPVWGGPLDQYIVAALDGHNVGGGNSSGKLDQSCGGLWIWLYIAGGVITEQNTRMMCSP